MKQFCIFVLTIFLSFQLYGQESAVSTKITLNTGEIYIGEIVVKTPDMVMIKAKNGTRYQFQLTEVKQIENILLADLSNTATANVLSVSQSEENFSGQLEISGGISNAKYAFAASPNAQASLTFGNKKAFGKDLFVGLGIGYNNVFVESGSTFLSLIPVFAKFQSTLTKDRTAPFIGVDAGYAFSVSPDFGGGTFIKLSAGITHRINFKTAFIVGIYAGLNSISGKLKETNDFGTFTYTGSTMIQNMGVKFGLQF
jgi:small nuclear ribonucleoprotein (snRNP)-like protein